MENLKRAANLLAAILGDLDRIPVEGLDNQRIFLSCADGIQTVRQVIAKYTEESKKTTPVTKVNGTVPNMENIDTEVENG
jgi:hypothetical protein